VVVVVAVAAARTKKLNLPLISSWKKEINTIADENPTFAQLLKNFPTFYGT
jgi:hypothetical protein